MSKKVFALVAAIAMLVSLVQFAPVNAATIVDGGEYTCTGGCFANWPASAVFLVQGSNLYAYASANVWRTYHPGQADFSTVVTVSSADLASYTVRGYVAPKVGTFVKAMNTSFVGSGIDTRTVYLVGLNGVFHPVYLASVYKYWTGDNNFQNIYGLPDAFTTVVVPTIGSNIDSTTAAPEGMAAMSLTGDYGYVGAGNTFRAFSSQSALDANKFNKTMAAKLPVSLSAGSNVTGAESGYVAYQTKTTSVLPNNGVLTAALASDNPASATVPQAASNVPLLKVALMNGNSSAVTINEMIFKRTGLGAVADWSGLYLFDEAKLLTTTSRTIASDTHEVTFTALTVSVPANSTKYITLKGDVPASGATAGDQHAFQLKSVAASGYSVNGLPVMGNTMNIGSVSLSGATITKTSTPGNPVVGQSGAVVANFNIANNGSNTQAFQQITLTYSGTVTRSEITNLKLTALGESTVLASAAGLESNDTVTMTLYSPYILTSGQNRSFSLIADLAGKKAQTIKFYVDQTYHVNVVDQFYGASVIITNSGTSAFDSTYAPQLSLQGGAVTMADLGPTAGSIAINQSDVTLTKFSIIADRAIEVKQLDVVLIGSAGMSDVVPGASGMVGDLRIKDCDSGTTLMSKSISTTNCVAGASCDFGTTRDTANTWRLTDAWNLTAGVKRNLCVTVDIGTSSHLTDDTTETIHADVWPVDHGSSDYYFRDINTGDYILAADTVPSSITGDTQSLTASSLTSAAASNPTTPSVVIGATNVDTLGATFTAGDGSDATIRQIGVRVFINKAATFLTANENLDASDNTVYPNAGVIKAALYDGSTLLGEKTLTNTTATAHDYGLATFSNLNVAVAKSGSKTLMVKLSYGASMADTIYVAAAVYGADVTAYDKDGNTITVSTNVNAVDGTNAPSRYVTVTTSGTLVMAQDGNTPDSGIVLAGTDNVITSKIKFTSTKENWTINKLRVKLNTTGNAGSVDTVYLSYPGGSATGTLNSSGYVNFTGLNWLVEKDTSEVLTISAKLKAIDPSATETGREIKLGVDYQNGFEAVGESMTTKLDIGSADVFGNALYLRKTMPVVTVNSGTGNLTNGTLSFLQTTIAANSKGALTVSKLSFAVTTSDYSTANLYVTGWKLYDGSTELTHVVWSDGTVTSSSGAVIFGAGGTGNSGTLVVALDAGYEKEIGAGSSKTFTLKGTVASAAVNDSVTVGLYGDNDTTMYTGDLKAHSTRLVDLLNATSNYAVDFCWSDEAKGSAHTDTRQSTYSADYADWSSGYLLSIPTDTRSYSWQ